MSREELAAYLTDTYRTTGENLFAALFGRNLASSPAGI